MYDADRNRLISAQELHRVLRQLGDKCSVDAAMDAADTTRLELPSPPPPLLAAVDPMPSSLVPLQPQAKEAGSSESEPAAPPPVVDEPYRDAASPPPPPPVVAAVASRARAGATATGPGRSTSASKMLSSRCLRECFKGR
jgi:hypothetical protein